MARIRSIKPAFFRDWDLYRLEVESGLPIRVAFAGLWTVADREGRFCWKPKELKPDVLPHDEVDFAAVLDALARGRFIQRYEVGGKVYGCVRSWTEHQRPRQDEELSKIPSPVADSDGSVPQQVLGKERKRNREVERKGEGGREPADGASAPETPEDLVLAWHTETHPPLPRCRELTSKRRRSASARLAERPLMEWAQVFSRIQGSAFCRGFNDRGWVATFDWVIGAADVAVKVLEGKYDDRRAVPRNGEPPITREERAKAEQFLKARGYCPHDPGCSSTPECVARMVKLWREEEHAVLREA